MKKILLFIVLSVLFLISRFYILRNPPYKAISGGYSDVKHDYERYANIWWYGLPPYLKYLYEYPPATIPLVIFPLFLDQKGIGKYYQNYRLQIFIFDLLFFLILVKFLNKLKIRGFSKILSILFYIFGGLIAKDFLYDGIDFIFSGTLALSLISFYFFSPRKILSRVLFWFLFWLSVGIKLISAPLLIPYFFLKKLTFKKEIISLIAGFILVWGLPLLIFRSSLSVIFVYNFSRSFKYASFPYFIVETINAFTKTETKIDQPPDFSLTGPYSVTILKLFNLFLPLAVAIVTFYALRLINRKGINHFLAAVKITLIYVFTFYLFSKIYSQPFPIWLIPLISILPFPSKKNQMIFMTLAVFSLIMDTTNILNLGLFGYKIFLYPLTFGFLRSCFKFGTMILLLVLSFKIPVTTSDGGRADPDLVGRSHACPVAKLYGDSSEV